ncbi:MAG TPA: hypothetical protein VGW40_13070 [Allosphingosinicella sp.]|nr:hypothetical protein [Allosphingosinicella sp.]
MKKLILFAAVAGLGLVSASPPDSDHDGMREARGGYPPCSRAVRDRCIQLYERGVRTPENLAENAKPEDEDEATEVMAADDGPCATPCAYHRRVLAQRIRRAGERG